MDFGSKLKELRTNANLTQKQLAELIGVTKSVISFYELRERTPSPEVLCKIASIFHVSTDFLLDIEKTKTLDVSDLEDEDIEAVKIMIDTLRKKNTKK